MTFFARYDIERHTNNGRRLAILERVCRRHFRWATGWFVSAPTAHLNRWEVISMMDQYVTFGDLLKICSVLPSLANLIVYIYYNHKNSNQNHHGKKKK